VEVSEQRTEEIKVIFETLGKPQNWCERPCSGQNTCFTYYFGRKYVQFIDLLLLSNIVPNISSIYFEQEISKTPSSE